VESKVARVKARLKLSECVHPECVAIGGTFGSTFNHPIANGRGVHFNSLLPTGFKYTDPVGGGMEMGVRVKVYRA